MTLLETVKTVGVPAPAVTVCGKRPNTVVPWKKFESLESALEACSGSSNVFTCMESLAWPKEDVVLVVEKGRIARESLQNLSSWNSEFLLYTACFTINSETRVDFDFNKDELLFYLNKSLDYIFYIHDPDYFVENFIPRTLPISYLKVFPITDCNKYVAFYSVGSDSRTDAER